VHVDHATISIQGWSPNFFHSHVHFEHCISNVVACNVLGWTLHTIGYGMTFDITQNAYTAPCKEWCIEAGKGHVPKIHPSSCPYGLKQIRQAVPSYVKICGVAQKNPPHPCVGWDDFYSHSNCRWLGQSMLLFPLPCLGRSLEINSLTLGHDVRPCAWKAPSFQKSTTICTSLDSNWTSLDVDKMQVAFQLWY